MHSELDRGLARTGAVAGIAAVLLLVGIVAATPAIPGPDASIAEIVRKATDSESGILLGAYMGALLGGALLLFGGCVAAALRRAEGPGGGWWLVALAGMAGTCVGIVSSAFVVGLVRAVEHGVQGPALWAGYSGDHALGVLMAVPLAVFMLGAGMGARKTRALARPLAWVAIVAAVFLTVGAGSITGDELDGGLLGGPLALGYAGSVVWILAVSVVLWRGRASGVAVREASSAA